MRRVIFALGMVLLCSCAVQRGLDLPPMPDWATRHKVLATLSDWGFTGRIGVSAGEEGFNGRLSWHQADNAFSATLSGPLGMGSIRLSGVGERVRIIEQDGTETELANAEEDLRAMYGWTIPVTSLRYWALGIPDPASPAMTEFGDNGRLSSLEQGNWRVTISQYRERGGQLMPRRMNAINADAKVRLVIDQGRFF